MAATHRHGLSGYQSSAQRYSAPAKESARNPNMLTVVEKLGAMGIDLVEVVANAIGPGSQADAVEKAKLALQMMPYAHPKLAATVVSGSVEVGAHRSFADVMADIHARAGAEALRPAIDVAAEDDDTND